MKLKAGTKTKFYTIKPNPHFKPSFKKSVKCIYCKVEEIHRKLGKLFGNCKGCGLRVLFYQPYEAQEIAGMLKNRNILMFSGVSSGKTTANGWSVIEHALTVPGAAIYILAQTVDQRDKNVKDQVLRQFVDEKEDLIKENESTWVFKNKSTIYFYTSDDYQKLKSANATLMWLVEAQGFKVELYFEAQQRARAQEAKKYLKDDKGEIVYVLDKTSGKQIPVVFEDRALVLVEGNIDPNSWIREFGVLQSHTIIGTPNTYHYKLAKFAKPVVDKKSGEVKDVVSIIMSPFDNYFNSKSFLHELKTGKTDTWIAQEVYGDLSLESGLFFPLAPKKIINPENHPSFLQWSDWMWIEGLDFGGAKINNDPTAYLLGKWNILTGEVIIIREYYRSGTTIAEDVNAILQIRNDHHFDILRSKFFVCDPSGRRSIKTDYGTKDLITMYKNAGLSNLKPAYASKGAGGLNNKLVSSGIVKINEMFAFNNLNISLDCENLNKELANYRRKVLKVEEQISGSKTIKALGADHAIDALRYMIMELPFVGDVSMIEASKARYDTIEKKATKRNPFAFVNQYMLGKR